MAHPIVGASNLPRLSLPLLSPGLTETASQGEELNFQNLLLDALAQTAQLERTAESATATKLAGGDITEVEVFSAMKKAELSLRMMLQIRNKLLEAFDEIKQLRM